MAAQSSRSSLLVVLVLVVAGMLLAYAFYRGKEVASGGGKVPVEYTQVDAGLAPPPMTEEERKKYVQDHVTVSGLEIVPDMKPGLDEPVPGLLEVHGKLHNQGDREIDRVFLHVFPMDADGKVIGSHIENVAKKKGELLQPGETLEFEFTIPEKEEFAGKFNHMLQ